MFNAGEDFLHFVFANEDSYCLKSLVHLNLDSLLCRELSASGHENIIFVSGTGSLDFSAPEEGSRYQLENASTPRFFGSKKKDWDIFYSLLAKSGSTALIMELNSFDDLCRRAGNSFIDKLIEGRRSFNAAGSLLLLRAGVSASDSADIFLREDSPFRHKNHMGQSLCGQISSILESGNSLPFYEACAAPMEGRMVFLNRLSEERLLNMLRYTELVMPERSMSPEREKEFARYIYSWFNNPSLRLTNSGLFSPNPRMQLSTVERELMTEHVWSSISSELELLSSDSSLSLDAFYRGCTEQSCIVLSDAVSGSVKALSLPEDLPPEYYGDFEEIKKYFCTVWNSPRSAEADTHICSCFQQLGTAIKKSDTELIKKYIKLMRKNGCRVYTGDTCNAVYSALDTLFALYSQYSRESRDLESSLATLSGYRKRIKEIDAVLIPLSEDGSLSQDDPRLLERYNLENNIKAMNIVIEKRRALLATLQGNIDKIEGPLFGNIISEDIRTIDMESIMTHVHAKDQELTDMLRLSSLMEGNINSGAPIKNASVSDESFASIKKQLEAEAAVEKNTSTEENEENEAHGLPQLTEDDYEQRLRNMKKRIYIEN